MYAATACWWRALVASRLARSRPPSKIGIETLGEMDATRLCQLKSVERLALWNPAELVSMKRGKNSAVATPIWALRATTVCSAAATSGRRARIWAGNPGGTVGGALSCSGLAAMANEEAGCPYRIDRALSRLALTRSA